MTLVVHMIGNAHLDPVWLWSWQGGADEVAATFRSAADRCDEYPEFVFTGGEAWRYTVVERSDPELFERIRALVREGRWSLPGGQWVQPDCNLPTGTAFRRQFERGQAYFEDRFGRRSVVGFNPDSFGHPVTLPDLLSEAGMSAYAFHRPSAEQLALPSQLFRWRGPAGGEVLAFRIAPAYVTRASDLAGQVEITLEACDRANGHTMCFYGVGNHGGGPTKAQIEWILEHRASFEGVELRFSTMDDFFEAVEPRRDELPLVDFELQHVFPGCYSVMHDVKQRQRRTEHLLEQTERIVAVLGPDDRATERLREAWDDVLFTAFHDVLAGTCVPSAWESVQAQQGRARIVAEEVAYDLTRRAARLLAPAAHTQIVAFNPDDEAWSGLIEVEPWIDFDEWGARWLSTPDGTPVPYQLVDAESDVLMTRVLFPARIEPHGWTTVLVRADECDTDPLCLKAAATAHGSVIAGGAVQVELGPSGIARVTEDGAELLGASGIQLHLRQDESDTWTMDADHFGAPIAARLEGLVWAIEEDGPLRARARGRGQVGGSPVELAVSVDADGRIELEVAITFVETHRALQLAVALRAAVSTHLDGVPGGAAERAPALTEWPVVGWSRVGAGGRDLALVTGDAYSVSAHDETWQWTLLRSPKMAWPPLPSKRRAAPRHTDQGEHRFSFRLHAGQSLPAELLSASARRQLQPPVVFSRYDGLARPPWGDVPPEKLWTEGERRNAARG